MKESLKSKKTLTKFLRHKDKTNNQILYFYDMDFMQIRKAIISDADEIALLFKLVTDQMVASNLDQWDYSYPIRKHILDDIMHDACYVWTKDGFVCGTISIDQNQDEQYNKINWSFQSENILVIHRLAVHPNFQGLGISKNLCLFAEQYAGSQSMASIRLDAYSINTISNRLYESLGYHKANEYCYFRNLKQPFYCYEKQL